MDAVTSAHACAQPGGQRPADSVGTCVRLYFLGVQEPAASNQGGADMKMTEDPRRAIG